MRFPTRIEIFYSSSNLFVESVGLGTAHLSVSSVDEVPAGLTETRVIDY